MSSPGQPMGIRHILARVNLRDFRDMVGNELTLVGTSLRGAIARPLLLPVAVLMALVRLVLLVVVIVVFGTSIAIISLVRGAFRTLRPPASGAS